MIRALLTTLVLSMTVKSALIFQPGLTTTGTQDFTAPGLGTPENEKALAIFWVMNDIDETDTSRTGQAAFGIGMTDGVRQVAFAAHSRTNVATTNTGARATNAHLVMALGINTGINGRAVFSAWIANGIRIEWVDGLSNAKRVGCLLLVGTDNDLQAYVGNDQISGTTGTTHSVTAPGFEPDVVVVGSAAHPFDDVPHSHSNLSLGFGSNDGAGGVAAQACLSHNDQDDVPTADPRAAVRDNRIMQLVSFNIGVGGEFELTDLLSTGFDLTVRNAAAVVSCDFAFAALKFTGVAYHVGLVTVPTSTGPQSITAPGFRPQFAMLLSNHINAVNVNSIVTGRDASRFGIGVWHEDGTEYHAETHSEDNAATALCSDYARPRTIETPSLGADLIENTEDGFDLDWTDVLAASRLFPFLAIETEAVVLEPPLGTLEVAPEATTVAIVQDAPLGTLEVAPEATTVAIVQDAPLAAVEIAPFQVALPLHVVVRPPLALLELATFPVELLVEAQPMTNYKRIWDLLCDLCKNGTYRRVDYTIDTCEVQEGATVAPVVVVEEHSTGAFAVASRNRRNLLDEISRWEWTARVDFDVAVTDEEFVNSILADPPTLARDEANGLPQVTLRLRRREIVRGPHQQASNGTRITYRFEAEIHPV